MGESNRGIKRILKVAQVYNIFQGLLGAKKATRNVVEKFIKPYPGMRILDIGCGPATILEYLPESIDYLGFDLNENYIQAAISRHKDRGTFINCRVNDFYKKKFLPFDLIIAFGVLHHLDEREALELIGIAHTMIKDDGRFISIDPCYVKGQHWLSQFFISCDRGKNIRNPQEALVLLKKEGNWRVKSTITHNSLRIPYTHLILEAQKNS